MPIQAGDIFNRFTVLSLSHKDEHYRKHFLCRCECGIEKTVQGSLLKNGNTKSCGCFRRDRMGDAFRSHGKSKTLQYCMFYDARKRAQRFGIPFTIEPDDIKIPDKCPVLGIQFGESRDFRPSLDRTVPSLGYTPSNILVVSFRANRIKSDATIEELRSIIAYMEGPQ